jgi:hypothetical protein
VKRQNSSMAARTTTRRSRKTGMPDEARADFSRRRSHLPAL